LADIYVVLKAANPSPKERSPDNIMAESRTQISAVEPTTDIRPTLFDLKAQLL